MSSTVLISRVRAWMPRGVHIDPIARGGMYVLSNIHALVTGHPTPLRGVERVPGRFVVLPGDPHEDEGHRAIRLAAARRLRRYLYFGEQ